MLLWFSNHYVAYTPPFCDKYILYIFFTITMQTRKIRNLEVLSQWFCLPQAMFYFFIYSKYYWSWNCSYLGVCWHAAAWLTISFFWDDSIVPQRNWIYKKLFVVCKICTQQVILLRRIISSWMLLCVLCMKWIKWMDNGSLGPFIHPNASSPILLNSYWRNLVL